MRIEDRIAPSGPRGAVSTGPVKSGLKAFSVSAERGGRDPRVPGISAAIAKILGGVRGELVVVVSATVAPAALRCLGAPQDPPSYQGVRVRILVSPTAGPGGLGALAPRPSTTAPVAVRLARTPVQEMVIADRGTALVCTASGFVPVLDPAITRSLHALFDNVWELSGKAKATPRAAPVRGLDGKVLAQLRDGSTDEVAARRLGVSLRTYRRYVAKIMQDVGATSRFQAGVLATERGLVQVSRARPAVDQEDNQTFTYSPGPR
jgi:hypothetical protein